MTVMMMRKKNLKMSKQTNRNDNDKNVSKPDTPPDLEDSQDNLHKNVNQDFKVNIVKQAILRLEKFLELASHGHQW